MRTAINSISSRVRETAVGDAGGISIIGNSVLISTNTNLDAGTRAQGDGKAISIKATDNITLDDDALLIAQVGPDATGNAGTITLSANTIEIKGDSTIIGNTRGQGNASLVSIIAKDSVIITEETSISSRVRETAVGDAGGISITGNSILINGESRLDAGTVGQGNGQDITINAVKNITLDDGVSIKAEVGTDAAGNAGNINLTADSLVITDDARLTVRSNGQGNPGNIEIAANTIELNKGEISAATAFGNFGNINLEVSENITLRNQSLISAQALNNANGGNIVIDTSFIVAFPNQNNDIIADAVGGNGGNININAEALFGIQERPLNDLSNDINVSSEFGLDGTVSIFTPNTNNLQTEINLPNSIIESEQTVAQACQSDRASGIASGLNIKGKGGVPFIPTNPFNSEIILVDEPITARDIKPIQTSMGNIYPARGIVKTEDGKIILTAYATDNLNSRTPHMSANCS
ncbi:MAG: hypothetical protein AAGA80_21325 [Cyanobacteria bacterium P01_F01_bin.143]